MSNDEVKDPWVAMDLMFAQQSWANAGYKVTQVIRKAQQLDEGCESSNFIWLVELEDGKKTVLTARLGEAYEMEYDDLQEKIFETHSSLQQLIDMSAHWPKDAK